MGDIEKFFNDNFFQKLGKPAATKANLERMDKEKKEFLHGVPESAYEPTVIETPKPQRSNVKAHQNFKANDPFRKVICGHFGFNKITQLISSRVP